MNCSKLHELPYRHERLQFSEKSWQAFLEGLPIHDAKSCAAACINSSIKINPNKRPSEQISLLALVILQFKHSFAFPKKAVYAKIYAAIFWIEIFVI